MATKSQGTLIKIGANSIAEVTGINGVALNKEAKDVHSISDTFAQFISTGVVDGGEISIAGFFNPNDTTGQKAMIDLLVAGTVTAFSVLWAALVTDFSFNGIVTAFTINTELDDAIGFEATIRTTGTLALGITASGGLTALSLVGTGGTLSPAFAVGNRSYSFGVVSATSVTVTATAASHTLKLFIDGVYSQDLTSASASAAIPVTLNVGKKLTIIANETGKAQQVTEIIVIKTS
jgi:hypothetical protein